MGRVTESNRKVEKYADTRPDRTVRVLQIGMGPNPGGIESFIMTYFRQMRKIGIQFDFISMFPEIAYEKEIRTLGGKVFHTADARKHPVRFYREMMYILKKRKYSVVHVNMLSAANIVPLMAAKRAEVPVIAAHSHNSSTPGLVRNVLHRANKGMIPRYANLYLACSGAAGQWLFSEKIRKGERYHLVKNALELDRFLFREEQRNAVRRELGLEDKFVIGHVGRFEEQKNHLFLLEVFREVARIRKDAVLLLAGDGELRPAAEKQVREYHLQDRVQFLGVRNDVDRLWKAMDIFLLPSLFEGLPIVALEAQASGVYSILADTITREVKLTDNLEFLSLNDPAGCWRDCILTHADYERGEEQNKKIRERFEKAGYDIESAARALAGYYSVQGNFGNRAGLKHL